MHPFTFGQKTAAAINSGTLPGLGVGAVGGGGIGALIGGAYGAIAPGEETVDGKKRKRSRLRGAVGGLLPGAAIGAAVGAPVGAYHGTQFVNDLDKTLDNMNEQFAARRDARLRQLGEQMAEGMNRAGKEVLAPAIDKGLNQLGTAFRDDVATTAKMIDLQLRLNRATNPTPLQSIYDRVMGKGLWSPGLQRDSAPPAATQVK